MITLYGKPGYQCPGCVAVKHWLKRAGAEYTFVDVTSDREALAFLLELGYSGVPVVVRGAKHFQGADPDKVQGFIRDQKSNL